MREFALYVGRDYQRQRHIARHLKSLEIELHKTPTAPAAKEMFGKNGYRLVLMHFNTVGKETFELCSFIRFRDAYAVLIALMADFSKSIERRLFTCGVNDVVARRQVSASALVARIESHLHHCNKLPPSQANIVRLKGAVVNFDSREVYCNKTKRKLRGLAPELLRYFLSNTARVISRDELLKSHIWGDSICSSAQEGGKTFDMAVSKLRKVIEPDPAHPQIIVTVRGQGWMLAEDAVS